MTNVEKLRLDMSKDLFATCLKDKVPVNIVLKNDNLKWTPEFNDKIINLDIKDEVFDHCFYVPENDNFFIEIMRNNESYTTTFESKDIIVLNDIEKKSHMLINEFVVDLKENPEDEVKKPYSMDEILKQLSDEDIDGCKNSINKFLENNPDLKKRFGVDKV